MQKLMPLKSTLFILILLCFFLQGHDHQEQLAFALSQSFTRQEIIDSSRDWTLWKKDTNTSPVITHDSDIIEVENAYNISQCKKSNNEFISSDIGSVSYVSDGKNLNATIWFTSPIEEPSLNDTIDIYQENLQVKDLTLSSDINLDRYVNITIAKLNSPRINFSLLEKQPTYLDGNEAYKLVYEALTTEGIKLKNMTHLVIDNGKIYDITYSAIEEKYNSSLPTIQGIINSIQFINSSSNSNGNINDTVKTNVEVGDGVKSNNLVESSYNNSNENNISKYEFRDLEIRINKPPGWDMEEKYSNDNKRIIIFKSPFSDKKQERPSWHEITLTMAIAIDSIQDMGITDYRIMLFREQDNDNKEWKWIKEIREVSAYDKTRVLEKASSLDIFDKKEKQQSSEYALFSFDLEKVNFPKQYRAVFYITDYFVKEHRLCRLIDTTNWVMVPPPEFTITTKPNSITLRPGEDINVELAIKGNVNLPTQAFISEITDANNIAKEQKIDFIQNNISIPPSGVGTSTFVVRLEDNAKSGSYTIPIGANISFPTTITNRGGESFSNSKSISSDTASNLTLTVLPPYTAEERFNSFVNAWVTPISGIWTFLAGVTAVLTPLIIKLYKKRKRKMRV